MRFFLKKIFHFLIAPLENWLSGRDIEEFEDRSSAKSQRL